MLEDLLEMTRTPFPSYIFDRKQCRHPAQAEHIRQMSRQRKMRLSLLGYQPMIEYAVSFSSSIRAVIGLFAIR